MENNMEKECSALGGLFQALINDLKLGVPVWEDFLAKATKLHSQLKATILSTTAFLDAFQKIADLATNARGATKDVGTALTRICLRHKAVEARLKTFTSALMECLLMPLQDKMEDWKKTVAQLDKDHAKEYKRARQEIKKRSSDTLRLQKKVRKGRSEIQRCLDSALQDVSDKFIVLEETEKQALRTALIEERSRFCLFVSFLKPVVDEEVSMLSETAHLQEVMEVLLKQTADPFTLPASSEQVINDLKNSEGSWSFQTPPSSPSTASSRKSSMCSISSMNSSSSGSTKCHSPALHLRYRSHSQPLVVGAPLRLPSVSSQDSGFTSQDTLFVHPHTPPPLLEFIQQGSGVSEQAGALMSNASTPSSPYGMLPMATSTWPNLQMEAGQFDKGGAGGGCGPIVGDRPHTISSTYERGAHQRPALTVHTFEPLDLQAMRQVNSTPSSPQSYEHLVEAASVSSSPGARSDHQPAIPKRAVSLERPSVPSKSGRFGSSSTKVSSSSTHCSPSKLAVLPDFHQPAPNQIIPQPLYVNMDELVVQPGTESVPRQSLQIYAGGIAHHHHASLEDSAHDGCLMEGGFQVTSPYGTLQSRTGSLRRSVSQSHKPPPPVRRTSSITSQHALTVVALRNVHSSQNLVAAAAAASSYSLSSPSASGSVTLTTSLDQLRLNGSSDTSAASAAAAPLPPSLQPLNGQMYEAPDAEVVVQQSPKLGAHARKSLPTMSLSDIALATPVAARKISLDDDVAVNRANLIQSLNVRLSQQTTNEKARKASSGSHQAESEATADVATTVDRGFQENFLHNLNAKLAHHVQKNASSSSSQSPPPPSSPPVAAASPVVVSPPPPQTIVGPRTEEPLPVHRINFKEELNAKLALKQSQQQPKATSSSSSKSSSRVSRSDSVRSNASEAAGGAASRVRQWMASRVPYDPVACRESLLDQIKQGSATLRKAVTDDRSAPRIQ